MLYVTNFAVRNWKQASALGTESNWKIINKVRDSGTAGITAKDLSKKLDLPLSTVYASLKMLENLDLIQSAKRKKERTKVYREHCWQVAHKVGINQSFLEEVRPEIMKITKVMEPVLLDNLENVVKDPKFKKYMPSTRKCPICKTSHEAYDLFHAITLMATHYCLHPGKFYEFLRKIDYRT